MASVGVRSAESADHCGQVVMFMREASAHAPASLLSLTIHYPLRSVPL